MKYKTIGVKGDKIPVIGQGAMGIGGYLDLDNSQDNFYLSKLRCCLDSGITLFDTAEVYGMGHSEVLIGRATSGARDKVFISSKVAPENLSYDDLINSANSSLERLGTDYLDLHMIHWPNNNISVEESLRAMSKLKKDGKIIHIGVSNFSLEELKQAIDVCEDKIDAIQLEYNLSERTIEQQILPFCDENNIIMMAYSPFDQGTLCGDSKKFNIFKSIVNKYDMSPSQGILNWLVSHPSVIAIPASKNEEHIKDNSKASDFSMSSSDIDKISRIFKKEKVYVYPEKIKVIDGGRRNKKVYKTIEEAIANKLNFTPSPVELSEEIKKVKKANPVKVRRINDETGMYDYELVEGRLRYWAWTIAFDWKEPLLVNIVNNE